VLPQVPCWQTLWRCLQVDLLTTAFSEAIEAEIYYRFLRRQIVEYLRGTYKLESCVLLVALLHPPKHGTQGARAGTTPHSCAANLLSSAVAHANFVHMLIVFCTVITMCILDGFVDDDGGAAKPAVVGSGMVSFSPEARNKTLTLNPPDGVPLLSNMAVAKEHQRQGIASLILRACEGVAAVRQPHSKVYLQARKKDAPALGLYKRHGYVIEKSDWPLVRLAGVEPMYLMTNHL
jgi:ribosomal protein S18 acetylase RimI-like enzyme